MYVYVQWRREYRSAVSASCAPRQDGCLLMLVMVPVRRGPVSPLRGRGRRSSDIGAAWEASHEVSLLWAQADSERSLRLALGSIRAQGPHLMRRWLPTLGEPSH